MTSLIETDLVLEILAFLYAKDVYSGLYQVSESVRSKVSEERIERICAHIQPHGKSNDHPFGDLSSNERHVGSTFYYCEGELHHSTRAAMVQNNQSGNVATERWYAHGRLGRSDGKDLPSVTTFDDDTPGRALTKQYYIDGKRHRVNKPASIYFFKTGRIKSEHYYHHGMLHRVDGPAKIHYFHDGTILGYEYWVNNLWHRVNGPAMMKRDKQHVTMIGYYRNGVLHRDCDRPARVIRDEVSRTMKLDWYIYGVITRNIYPAHIVADFKGHVISMEWWYEGRAQRTMPPTGWFLPLDQIVFRDEQQCPICEPSVPVHPMSECEWITKRNQDNGQLVMDSQLALHPNSLVSFLGKRPRPV